MKHREHAQQGGNVDRLRVNDDRRNFEHQKDDTLENLKICRQDDTVVDNQMTRGCSNDSVFHVAAGDKSMITKVPTVTDTSQKKVHRRKDVSLEDEKPEKGLRKEIINYLRGLQKKRCISAGKVWKGSGTFCKEPYQATTHMIRTCSKTVDL